MKRVTVVGGGLAGSEACWQLASRGVAVDLYEMRPVQTTKAHKTGLCAELVCSNSFRGADLANAVGLLKEELRRLGSLVFEAADFAQVPAGGALAVDRDVFSRFIDQRIREHPLITLHTEEIETIPEPDPSHPVIIATGPLTSPALSRSIEELTGSGSLAFFDAISPILLNESLDHEKLFRMSRYEKGGGDDYLNVPLSKEQYYTFVDEILRAEKFGTHEEVEADLINNLRPFEGCMPIEEMAARGPDTLLFGPLKPVGLVDPHTGHRPYAVLQLRQDDKAGELWSMVGMQTRMKHGEQMRVFRMLPGLENCEFVRLGTVHRNTFIDSPKHLDPTLLFRTRPGLLFAGQITGVEGYVESTAGGFVAGINAFRLINGQLPYVFSADTAIGSLMRYISDAERKEFQPMNINFGLMSSYFDELGGKKRGENKKDRRLRVAERALLQIAEIRKEIGLEPLACAESAAAP